MLDETVLKSEDEVRLETEDKIGEEELDSAVEDIDSTIDGLASMVDELIEDFFVALTFAGVMDGSSSFSSGTAEAKLVEIDELASKELISDVIESVDKLAFDTDAEGLSVGVIEFVDELASDTDAEGLSVDVMGLASTVTKNEEEVEEVEESFGRVKFSGESWPVEFSGRAEKLPGGRLKFPGIEKFDGSEKLLGSVK